MCYKTSEPCKVSSCLPQMAPPASFIWDALLCGCDCPVVQNQVEECIKKLTKGFMLRIHSFKSSNPLHGAAGTARHGGCPSFRLMSESLHFVDGQ